MPEVNIPIVKTANIDELFNAYTILRKELEYLLYNLDSDNVTEAASAITTNTFAGNISANQINAGTLNNEVVEITNNYGSVTSSKIRVTPEGGTAILLTNKTGANSVKGEVVSVSPTFNNAVAKIIVNVPDPIGVFYESGIADGSEVWIVVSGIADVYFIGNTTRGHLARGFITADAGYVTGQVLSEAVPTSPFATDKHFYEIGHVLESRTGAGLAKCVLHFN